ESIPVTAWPVLPRPIFVAIEPEVRSSAVDELNRMAEGLDVPAAAAIARVRSSPTAPEKPRADLASQDGRAIDAPMLELEWLEIDELPNSKKAAAAQEMSRRWGGRAPAITRMITATMSRAAPQRVSATSPEPI